MHDNIDVCYYCHFEYDNRIFFNHTNQCSERLSFLLKARYKLKHLIESLEIPIKEVPPSENERFLWNGKYLAIFSWDNVFHEMTFESITHEIAHWVLAPKELKHLGNFGLNPLKPANDQEIKVIILQSIYLGWLGLPVEPFYQPCNLFQHVMDLVRGNHVPPEYY